MKIKLKDLLKEDQDDFELQGKKKWHGLIIDIENKKGSIRSGKDADGSAWKIKMHADYGRIRGTKTKADQEELDVYVLSNGDAENVYQIKQMRAPNFEKFDEYKYILNANSPEEAKQLYLKQYDDKRFYGGMISIPTKDFVSQIKGYMTKKQIKN